VGGGIKVHSTLRPPMAYCASPGWLWWWRNRWNDLQGKPKYSEKTCPSAALSTTNPTCCPYANPGRRGGKPASNRLSYGTAINTVLVCVFIISDIGMPLDQKIWQQRLNCRLGACRVTNEARVRMILSCVLVIIDGVLIRNWISWSLTGRYYK
jgi:hypothetical protein